MSLNIPSALAVVLGGVGLIFVTAFVGWLLVALGLVWAAGYLLYEFAGDRFPSIAVSKAPPGGGFSVSFRPPRGSRRRRVRTDALQLAKDIHAYLASMPSASAESIREHHERTQAMRRAETEAERDAIWRQSTERMAESSDRERQDLYARFGGRLTYVVDEFAALGLLDNDELDASRSRMLWSLGSRHWCAELASQVEALARRL